MRTYKVQIIAYNPSGVTYIELQACGASHAVQMAKAIYGNNPNLRVASACPK